MKHQKPKETIKKLLERKGRVSNRDVVRATGLTPQAVHYHLKAMLRAGQIICQGRGRATTYTLPQQDAWRFSFQRQGLAEDEAWQEVRTAVEPFARLTEPAVSIYEYSFTEMLNNAIDHSNARTVEVSVQDKGDTLLFEIVDDGVGIFTRIRDELDLESRLVALQELSKGKLTTLPSHHTGEGIFFVSKVADRFEVESDGLVWIVDNELPDMAIEQVEMTTRGTRVRFEASLPPKRTLRETFAAYTEDYEFEKTRTVVKLFDTGERFISRSQAKRLMHRLDHFEEVILDFRGVTGVGQGFVDEIFRVWASAHPQVRLVPENMNEAVEFMVRRGLPRIDTRPDADTQ